jgi:hypothetical protein
MASFFCREVTSRIASRRFKYAESIARNKANLDIQWQQTNPIQGETPQALMREILKDLEEAIKEFAAAESELRH